MLNANLERYNRIADYLGFIFFCKCMQEGVRSVDGVQQMCLHNKDCVDLNTSAFSMLLESMDLLTFEDSNKTIIKEVSESLLTPEENQLKEFFCQTYTRFLINEKILPTGALKYDEISDFYKIEFSAINFKYACYRNLLCSLGIFTMPNEGKYIVSPSILDIFEENQNAMSEETLLKILEKEREQGDLGEEYVVAYEKNRLKNHLECLKIKRISKLDVSAGFDIVSFIDEKSKALDLCIEVKTYSGKPHFYWSKNEMEQAKLRTIHYSIYLVDYKEIGNANYTPIIINDPISFFADNPNWLIETESYSIKEMLNK